MESTEHKEIPSGEVGENGYVVRPMPVTNDEDLHYGWGSFTPNCLQKLNKGWFFLICMSLMNFTMSMSVNGLIGTNLSTIERRYDLTSSASGVIVSAYDICCAILVLFVGYFGSTAHKPKWCALGVLGTGLGSIVFIIPHIAIGPYRYSNSGQSENICIPGRNDSYDQCADGGGSLSNWAYMFFTGNFMHGLGSVVMYTVGVAYLDDSTTREMSALYIGIFYGMGVIGPAVGYALGGALFQVFVDAGKVDLSKLTITSSDPRWIGAWWIGFVITACLMLLLVLPFGGFPRDIPGAAAIRASKKSESHSTDDSYDAPPLQGSRHIRDLPRSVWQLIKNPAYVFSTGFSLTEAVLISGFSAFGPKYLENQFHLNGGFAGMLFGVIAVPGGAGGTIFGGWLIKHYSLKCKSILKLQFILTVVSMCLAPLFFARCSTLPFVGINKPYNNSILQRENFTDICNSGCECSKLRFEPLCGRDESMYYSPCYAGCSGMDSSDPKKFYNCSCISTPSHDIPGAESNICSVNCTLLPLFILLWFIVMFFTFTCNVLNVNAILRVVPHDERTTAVGIQSTVLRLLGTVPGNVLFGAALDTACTLWSTTCSGRGSCSTYDNYRMALYMFLIGVSFKFLSSVFVFLAWWFYKAPPDDEFSTKDIAKQIELRDDMGNNNEIISKETPLDHDIGKQDPEIIEDGYTNKAFRNDQNADVTVL